MFPPKDELARLRRCSFAAARQVMSHFLAQMRAHSQASLSLYKKQMKKPWDTAMQTVRRFMLNVAALCPCCFEYTLFMWLKLYKKYFAMNFQRYFSHFATHFRCRHTHLPQVEGSVIDVFPVTGGLRLI
uniref:Uncharacterized protein n=1 Tax=Rhipicephalus microplus TaxID=6941 RepID=A0A6G5AGC9_RHIMP